MIFCLSRYVLLCVYRVSGMAAKTTVQMVMKVDDILDDVK